MPGGINDRYLEFQPVMKSVSMIARRLVGEIGEKMAGWRADLLIRRSGR
jgi:hypothetical protein